MASGRCLCGQVSFDIAQGVENCLVSYNHARGYREWTGAAFFDALLAPASVVVFHDANGMLRSHEAGPTVRQFCGACGTPLSCRNASGNTIELNRGVMHNTSGTIAAPMYHIQCAEGLPHILNSLQDGLPRFPGLPDASGGNSANNRNGNSIGSSGDQNMGTPKAMVPRFASSSHSQQSSASSSAHYASDHTATAYSIETSQPKQTLRLHASHIVDENSVANKAHGIISVPCDNIVELIHGDLQTGLGGEYAEYIEVLHQGRVGKISRKVVTPVDTNPHVTQAPPHLLAPPPHANQAWGGEHADPHSGSSHSSNGSTAGLETGMDKMDLAGTAPSPSSFGGNSLYQHAQQSMPGNGDDYIPAGDFKGVRPGYVFKTAERGVGYYKDQAKTVTFASDAGPSSTKQHAAPTGGQKPQRKAPPGIKGKRRY
ncbi:Hypothetical Protein FCC1311_044912 [Hondaea fermentalgiana]|uniref:CENP-V/GFA domain-containing protein n=1 Tax=Hondaea fermentalgiana TaxID=2315210 RepID=A0A2R5GEV6_9STRA|nr:Hypothetical Protein FCC1311_044912 [Hondaea fermentalgiana]|eukprot:GBG28268.1 Hypothetical Protein FCC1311_044912 [Hondaea fermentalgiana]